MIRGGRPAAKAMATWGSGLIMRAPTLGGGEVVPGAGEGGLFGMAAASRLVAALEHADLQAGLGQVGRCAEAVVAPSDYDRIVASVWHFPTSVRSTTWRGRSLP